MKRLKECRKTCSSVIPAKALPTGRQAGIHCPVLVPRLRGDDKDMGRAFSTTSLILIRHGETEYTEQRRYCGHSNIPLNSKGIRQAELLRNRFKKESIDRIYSSDLKRSTHTAEIAFPKRIIRKKRRLREIDFGDFVGRTWSESSRIYPGIYEKWLSKPGEVKIPGGETIRDFAGRVESCFNEIQAENQNRSVAIVTHGGVIRIILMKLSGVGFEKFWEIEQHTACVNIVLFNSDTLKITAINDRKHL